MTALPPVPASLGADLASKGFGYAPAMQTMPWLEGYGLKDWPGFAESWNNLGVDRFMADGGRYRRRRYAVFSVRCPEGQEPILTRKPHQPHYQSRDYNPINGGVERWFNPIEDHIAHHPAMQACLKAALSRANALTAPEKRPPSWHVEVHQFRIEAAPGMDGNPNPEGLHRDGVDWVYAMMVQRRNVQQGDTTITALDKKTPLGHFTLTNPMDVAFVNDHKVYHGATPVKPVVEDKPAWRDVLVITMRHE
ncbi:2OG-Fe dioxygenase family protein [Formicincola oecophyllae]|nr:2OG-Fe dioxygenase family protein [Formicincola oecophyllae]